MTELRRRKLGKEKHTQSKNHPHTLHLKQVAEDRDRILWTGLSWVNLVVGILIAFYIGYKYAKYVGDLHENDMWFSNIKQVEREISFRTEAGLYFSYYKQMVLAPTISEGIRQLMYDNKTEHLRTINILNRFNVYQEVILAVIYKALNLKNYLEYVYFYINTVFGLHGMYMVAIYFSSWLMSGTWLAGVLGTAFYAYNRVDTTRVSYTIPLRESFSLPFIYMQLAAITLYFKPGISQRMQAFGLAGIFIGTLFTIITWQFAQFVFLLEGFALFGAWCLDIIPRKKAQSVLFVISGCLLLVCVIQFINDMLITSLTLHFCLAALLIIELTDNGGQGQGIFRRIFKLLFTAVAVLALTFIINFVLKNFILKIDSDEHIFKFVLAKMGYGEALKRDFDSLLYLCEGAFNYLPMDTFIRLTDGIVFPCYAAAMLVTLILLATSVLAKWSGEKPVAYPWMVHYYPEVAFSCILSVFFGLMALSTLRMKFLWTPHICMVGAGIFCHQDFWRWVFSSSKIKDGISHIFGYLVPIAIIGLVLWRRLPSALEELKSLREFYDPDTVELMTWISGKTPDQAAFTGSMQLLAGVKLCTDRPITNHPHYENKFLRQRTKDVYQIYARKSPKEVYEILRQHGSSYIILENSICYSRSEQGCRLTDILDIDNGDKVLENPADTEPGQRPRFCHAIKYDKSFSKYFTKVFENPTFYLYKLN
ncbi:protein C-mannosyl-transferase DPY19L3-like [Rhopilema esculentum]|uniref:protein C-mannosyl-transferase DPY19L3-like n=1 Tax=Rhopilema esculentum TaxID=499914 RepID=UPI0031DCC441|eukprot:gene17622-9262_t